MTLAYVLEAFFVGSVGAIRLLGIGVLLVVLVVVLACVPGPPRAAVSGRVVDEAGRPVKGIQVGLMSDSFDFGGAAVRETDSDGRYRLEPVYPGEYYLKAKPLVPYISDATYLPAGTVVPEEMAAQGLGYLFTFYPSAATATGAQRLVIEPGDELTNIDITVLQARTPRLSGTVLLPSGEPADRGSVTLYNEGWYSVHAADIAADGSFTFPAMWPSNYHMTTSTRYVDSENRDCAALPITVTDADIDGIVLAAAPVPRIRGKATGPDLPSMLRMPQVIAHEDGASGTGLAPNGGDMRADWTFNIAGACGPTRVQVRGLPEGWYVESILLGDRDITDKAVDFARETAGEELEIVLSPDAPELRAQVVNAQTGQPLRGGVIVFPPDPLQWKNGSRFIMHSWTGQTGLYLLHGLPPGDYLVAAFAYTSTEVYNFAALQHFKTVATPVRLEAGQTAEITVSPEWTR